MENELGISQISLINDFEAVGYGILGLNTKDLETLQPGEPKSDTPIAVIGAGIAGTTTAYALVKKGHNVTIIDSRRYPAMATSYANGGQLSASNAETWNTTKNVVSGIFSESKGFPNQK